LQARVTHAKRWADSRVGLRDVLVPIIASFCGMREVAYRTKDLFLKAARSNEVGRKL